MTCHEYPYRVGYLPYVILGLHPEVSFSAEKVPFRAVKDVPDVMAQTSYFPTPTPEIKALSSWSLALLAIYEETIKVQSVSYQSNEFTPF